MVFHNQSNSHYTNNSQGDSSIKHFSSFFVLIIVGAMMLGTTQLMAQKKSKKDAVAWAAEDMKWMEAKEAPGIKYVDVTGHMDKGAYSAFVRLPAGSKHPLHTHTSDVKVVVISGTFLYAPEGGEERKLGPGSYLFVPGGLRQTSGVAEGSDCVMFQQGTGKFDMIPVVEEKK